MTQSDLDVLLDMGFDKERAEIAVKKSGGLQGALQWLEDNQDKPIDEIRAADKSGGSDAPAEASTAAADEDEEGAPALQPGEEAKSLVCDDCGKKFRSTAQAEFHATKTDHQNFSQSTEEIAPLTEEEKKAKLLEIKERLAEKRKAQALADREEQKNNERIRRQNDKTSQDVKEDLQKKQQLKDAEAKKREKAADIAAKERVKAKIEADKQERKLRVEREKAEREGRPPPEHVAPPREEKAQPAQPTVTHNEARIRLQMPGATLTKIFPAETTLFEVAEAVSAESGFTVQSFAIAFPRKSFTRGADFGQTLKEAGMVPSAALVVR